MKQLNPVTCVLIFDGEQCDRPVHNKTLGYCNAHYLQYYRGEELRKARYSKTYYRSQNCDFEGCRNPAVGKGLCHAHGWQLKHKGDMKPLYETQVERFQHCERDDRGRKRCWSCRCWLEESEFSRSSASADGLKSWCKTCRADEGLRNRDKTHLTRVQRNYNVPREWYGQQLEAQGGVCAICDSPPGKKRLSVDHDHSCCQGLNSCGKCVRGLLCGGCNTAIGSFKDDPRILARALNYLEESKS